MQLILRFLRQNSPFFTWLLLAVASVLLLMQGNPYHRSIWFGTANRVTGSVLNAVSGVTDYFGLRATNEELLARTGALEEENLRLRSMIQAYGDVARMQLDTTTHYTYTIAHVVGNSIHQADNYITLDKGAADGVAADMGVANQNGVVGTVVRVSDHYALVLSLLNSKTRLSSMVRGNEASGTLVWDGADTGFALLEQLSRSVTVQVGDTVVTTGYTDAFPRGVPVGEVAETIDNGADFLTLRVRLFTDFGRLSDVHVIHNHDLAEQKALEATLTNN